MTHLTPYSIRLSQAQRDFIRQQAQRHGLKESQWVRKRLFQEEGLILPQHTLRVPLSHKKELAQILYLLGQSRMANNLNQIAKAVNMGTLVISPDAYHQIDESYHSIRWMRGALITGLGLRDTGSTQARLRKASP